MATTSWPTRTRSESASFTVGSGPSASAGICTTATSKMGSAPISRAGRRVPSSSVTTMDCRSNTTWALVSSTPRPSMRNPEPALRDTRSASR
jgi:hypothetical protein